MGQILLDHPLSYALTTTTVFLVVYLQQSWKTVSKLPNTKDAIRFKLNSQEIVYNVYMFRSTLNLLVETTANPFIEPTTMKFIQPFMHIIGYQGVVDKTRRGVSFHKDNIPLLNVYTTGSATMRWMLILNEFITDETRATKEYKEYVKVFVRVEVPRIQLQPVVTSQGTHRNTPSAFRSPTLTTDIVSKKKRKQVAKETSSPRKSLKLTIRQKKKTTTLIPPPGDDQERDDMDEATFLSENNEQSYASEFLDLMFQDDDDDSGTRTEPGIHKEHPKIIDDDDDKPEKEKKDDEMNDENVNDDEKKDETGSMKTRKEKMQTPIPSPTRSLRKNLSSDKTLSKELMETISPSNATTSKAQQKTRRISRINSLGMSTNILFQVT
nr:hypothetical protein [Tanacetum cinerariifolium]